MEGTVKGKFPYVFMDNGQGITKDVAFEIDFATEDSIDFSTMEARIQTYVNVAATLYQTKTGAWTYDKLDNPPADFEESITGYVKNTLKMVYQTVFDNMKLKSLSLAEESPANQTVIVAGAASPGMVPLLAWACICGTQNKGNFCTNCGQQRSWTCSCGAKNSGKFCIECGSPMK